MRSRVRIRFGTDNHPQWWARRVHHDLGTTQNGRTHDLDGRTGGVGGPCRFGTVLKRSQDAETVDFDVDTARDPEAERAEDLRGHDGGCRVDKRRVGEIHMGGPEQGRGGDASGDHKRR